MVFPKSRFALPSRTALQHPRLERLLVWPAWGRPRRRDVKGPPGGMDARMCMGREDQTVGGGLRDGDSGPDLARAAWSSRRIVPRPELLRRDARLELAYEDDGATVFVGRR